MKKILLTIALLSVSLSMFSQKLGYKKDNDTEFSIGVNYAFVEHLGIGMSFLLNKETGEKNWGISIIVPNQYSDFSFDRNSLLLIKTFSGSIIELHELMEYNQVERDIYHITPSIAIHRSSPLYLLAIEDLNKIISEGVEKLRFDSTIGFIDFSYTEDKLGPLFKKQKDIIIEESNFYRSY